jgi:hypothetical protein
MKPRSQKHDGASHGASGTLAAGGRLGGIGALLFAAGLCLLVSGAVSAEDRAEQIEEARAALEQWVETRRVISKEQQDWALGREMLNERLELVQREIESLGERIKDAEDSIAQADKKRADLFEENEDLKALATTLGETAAGLEQSILALLKRLPDPIRERVKPLSQRLPANANESRLSLGERFQNIVGILNEVNKFNREITVTSEVHTLPDGTSAEVTALYVGIGQGYFANADGTVGGVGSATESGWVWKPANESAAEIAKAIAILKNEHVAEFVLLPITID